MVLAYDKIFHVEISLAVWGDMSDQLEKVSLTDGLPANLKVEKCDQAVLPRELRSTRMCRLVERGART